MAEGVAENGAGAAEGVERAQAASSIDFSPVLERFDSMMPRLETLEQSIGQLAGGDDGGGDGGDDGFEFDLESLYGDPTGEQQNQQQRELDPQALQSLIDTRAQQLLEQQLGPLAQQVQHIQVGLDAEALTAKYPDLEKPEVVGPVVEKARALAEAMGDPRLAQNAQFVEVIYKAQMADARAAGEQPAGAEQGFELERAGGAGPAAGEAPNIAERLVQKGQDGAFWKTFG